MGDLLIFFILPLSCLAQHPMPCNSGSQCSNNQSSICTSEGVCECMSGYFTPGGSATDCISLDEPDPACSIYSSECVFCGSSYNGPCLKCTNLVTSDGKCVDNCNGAFQITIIPNTTLTARVCEDPTESSTPQLPQWAIIVIAVMSGLVLLTGLVVILVFAFTWFNRYSSGTFEVEDTNTSLVQPETSHTFGADLRLESDVSNRHTELDDVDSENEFFQKLAYLRNHAEVFLSMLNDMRRRLKELPQDAPTAQQYRNVMRDVTRLLYLLNKKSSAIEVPPDGIQLLTWSEQILQRYMASQV
ncbi:hypothetical protein GBAR_LOCUS19918 [Geodia barretti]|uniref:EGF-like domain-containing protein n=2 Tax=Geodia barretti TaxID=519541 RepID=A0AA35SV25_GEOBA|nr:hypothetical protein GBAR_LOCUS19918 [Geodia barretti]